VNNFKIALKVLAGGFATADSVSKTPSGLVQERLEGQIDARKMALSIDHIQEIL